MRTHVDYKHANYMYMNYTRSEVKDMNRKKILRNLMILSMVVAICILALVVKTALNNNKTDYGKYAFYKSTIQKDDCYLCGNNPDSSIAPYLGESNIGLINLNTFDCFRFEVNRYDENHKLIEKLAKYGTSKGWRGNEDTGSTFNYDVYCNKGYLSAYVHFNDNSDLQLDRIQSFLCSDCLKTVMKEYQSDERHLDIALIDFQDGTIKPFQKGTVGVYLSDYYVTIQYNTEHDTLNLIGFYCPDRYSEYDYDPNLSVTDEIVQYCNDNNFAFTLNDEVKNFLSGFERIGGITYTDDSVTFQNESFIGSKELTIHKDGTYNIFDLDEPEENTEE